jgi:hypothetical protein
MSAGRPKVRHEGTCRNCGKIFESRYAGKIYCGIKCYTSSPDFLNRLRLQAVKANAAHILKLTGETPKPKVEISCLNCGVVKIVRASRGKEKYCNHRCYRQYMAGRFDRWIASPQAIALPQAYDEFLSQEELPCLIEGCDWVGRGLGNHVNFTHGIQVEEFKRAAGFNKKTGLVTPATSEALSARPHIHDNAFGGRRGANDFSTTPPPIVRNYRSLEGREHSAKARALMEATVELPPRTCEGCGEEFQPAPLAWSAKFCSIQCRDAFYQRNRKNIKFWMNCSQCQKDFQGLINQRRRAERGLKVFCSIKCRQSHNGKKAGEAHHQRYLKRIQATL